MTFIDRSPRRAPATRVFPHAHSGAGNHHGGATHSPTTSLDATTRDSGTCAAGPFAPGVYVDP